MAISLKQVYKESMNCNTMQNPNTDTEYRLDIDHEAKTIILCFQGSTRFIKKDKVTLDWKQNLDFWYKPYKNMKHLFFVHRGLFKKYKSVQDDIYEVVKDLSHYQMRIYGASQGGTLAMFAHEDYWFKGFDPTTYATAAPKGFTFWNKKVLKERMAKCHNIYHVNDIVPKVPFWWMGFIKYGHKIKLGKWSFTYPWEYCDIHISYKEYL